MLYCCYLSTTNDKIFIIYIETCVEAEDKVMLLHKEDNVYTSDSGRTAATNAEEDRKALKFRSTVQMTV